MSGLMPPNILSYVGQVVVPFINRTFPPQTTFNDFSVPTIWIDTAAQNAYILVAKPMGVADWILLGGSGGTLNTITTPDSVVVNPVAGNINFLNGPGMNITGAGNNVTFTTTGLGLFWSDVSGTTQAMAVNHGYVADNGALVTFTLPVTAAFGDIMWVVGRGGGGWAIDQNAGQQMILGGLSTTVGVGGSISSTNQRDSVLLLCTLQDTEFTVLTAVGNPTIV